MNTRVSLGSSQEAQLVGKTALKYRNELFNPQENLRQPADVDDRLFVGSSLNSWRPHV